MFISLSKLLLRVLAASAASISFVAAQTSETEITTEQLYGTLSSTTAPAPGFNADGGSVFQNYVDAVNNGQAFLRATLSYVYEKPESETVQYTILRWCSDLTFSDFSNVSLVGYAARCASTLLAGYAEAVASGTQLSYEYSEGYFGKTASISAVFVEQLNSFQGQIHCNTDDKVLRYWDDGRKTMPMIGWEGHDEGDMASNAATSSWSGLGDLTWMSVEEVAQLFNTSVDDFTPEIFNKVYEDAWIKSHEEEAAADNPNSDAELEIVEEVKNETDSADEIVTPPAQPDSTEEDDGTDPFDDPASGRKLASVVAARFVSAALRVFGI